MELSSIITMDHGSGGVKTSQLIDSVFRPAFSNPELDAMNDGAILPPLEGPLAFSTDSFVVQPLEFPGGDIGKLAVCGTVNDVAMCGALPRWMSFSVILEEGFSTELLKRIVQSAAQTAHEAGVQIVTGDTKVVEKGHGDGIYINTSGVGQILYTGLSPKNIQNGDAILVTGPIGSHGACIMLQRSGLGLEGSLKSDCMPLHRLALAACEAGKGSVRCLRDATRGGVATTLNEFVEGTAMGIRLLENALPVEPQTRAVCELLGLDPLYCACEGRMLCVVAEEKADAVLAALHSLPGGEQAAKIGSADTRFAGKVVLQNTLGANRILTKLTGAQLPRIC